MWIIFNNINTQTISIYVAVSNILQKNYLNLIYLTWIFFKNSQNIVYVHLSYMWAYTDIQASEHFRLGYIFK